MKEAKCPHCETRILWDWDNDYHTFEDGKPLFRDQLTDHVFADRCPCGTIIGVVIEEESECIVYGHPDLADIDWTEPVNYTNDFKREEGKE